MKILRRIVGILTAAALLCSFSTSVLAAAPMEDIDDNYYTLNEHWEDNSALHRDCYEGDNYSITHGNMDIGAPVPVLLEQLHGIPITCMRHAFAHDFGGSYQKVPVAPAIPKYVQDLSYAFSGCEFSAPPLIPSMVQDMELSFNGCKNMSSFPDLPSGVTFLKSTFSGCSNASGTVKVPDTVTEIDNAFGNCLKLTTFPDLSKLNDLTSAMGTFNGCTNTTGGTDLPNGVLTDTSYLFSDCVKMTTAPKVIYDSITKINKMFYRCENLSGTIDVRAVLSLDKSADYADAFTGVSSVNGAELILNYTAQNEAVIDDIISKKTIVNNIKKGMLLTDEIPPEGGSGEDSGGTPPEIPPVTPPANSLPIVDGKGNQDVIIQGIVEPINTLDVDVPLNLQFIIDENRDIHYTKNAKIISRSPAPLMAFSKSVTLPQGAPKLVADDAFADWNNLTIAQTRANIAISINGKNLSTAGIKLGDIASGYGTEANLPLNLSVLYGKQWNNTSQLIFDYSMNLELALAN